MGRLEALIARVRVATHGEYVNVPMANPRDGFVSEAADATAQVGGLA